jgi:predicted transposase/invertase (TIGR01784 family)
MGKFINPFTDVGFKRIFGQEVSKPVLLAFLNSLLEGERKIVDLKFLDKEQLGISDGDRSLIYDVYCETDTKEHIIVEMQYKYQPYFKERSIYYTARSIVEQGERGNEWRYNIEAVYLVAFLNFKISDISQDFRTDVALMDMEHHTVFSDKVRLVYLQLPYFNKEADDCITIFEKIIYTLKHMDILERMPWMAQNAVFQRLSEIAEVASLTKEERIKYDAGLKAYRDTIAVMDGQYELGEQKGFVEGRAEGRAEGIEATNRENARKMKQKGIANDVIADVTGLSIGEIQQL